MTRSSTTSVEVPPGVDADAAYGDLAGLGGGVLIHFEDVAVFEEDGLFDHAHCACELYVTLEVAVVAVDGHEELGADEVDHQPELFLAAVAGDVDEAGVSVVVDDVGVAALEVVDHAIDGLLVAGDDARAEQDGVACVNVGELVVVDGGPAERAHGLALGAADHDEELVGRVLLDLAGVDDEAGGQIEGSQGPGRSRSSYRASGR